jgi:hypothetical protein
MSTLSILLAFALQANIATTISTMSLAYVDDSVVCQQTGLLAVAAYNGDIDTVVICKPDSNGVYHLVNIISE